MLETTPPPGGDGGRARHRCGFGERTRILPQPPSTVTLRDYQREAVAALDRALAAGGSPLVVAPCGAGKSLMIADAARRAVAGSQRVAVFAHVRELLTQNRGALAKLDPDLAAASTFACTALGPVDLSGPVVFASPQTVAGRLDELPPFDLVVIDEAHLVPRASSSRYRRILDRLRALNPALRVVGFTATPFRLDTGRLDDGEVFDRVAFDLPVQRLLDAGHLVPLVAPRVTATMRLDGIAKRRGDFIPSALHDRFASDADHARAVVHEIIRHGEARRAWLVFAIDCDHARLLTATLHADGIDAAAVLGSTPKSERDDVLDAFKGGALRCVVNVGIATTGFDAPAVDLLALCRPTASTALHVQMLGRGMRPAPGKADCLALDFAANVRRLGSPTAPRVPTGRKAEGRGAGHGEGIGARGEAAPYRDRLAATVDEVDPMTGAAPVRVLEVTYVRHDKPGKPPSLRVVYRLDGIGRRSEWWPLQCPNAWARRQARERWRERAPAGLPMPATVDEALRLASRLRVPPAVRVVPRPGKPDEVVPLWGATDGR